MKNVCQRCCRYFPNVTDNRCPVCGRKLKETEIDSWGYVCDERTEVEQPEKKTTIFSALMNMFSESDSDTDNNTQDADSFWNMMTDTSNGSEPDLASGSEPDSAKRIRIICIALLVIGAVLVVLFIPVVQRFVVSFLVAGALAYVAILAITKGKGEPYVLAVIASAIGLFAAFAMLNIGGLGDSVNAVVGKIISVLTDIAFWAILIAIAVSLIKRR